MKNQYRVRSGIHIEQGVTYKKGDVVISERDLSQSFSQKFDSLGSVKENDPAPEVLKAEVIESLPPTKAKGRKKVGKEDWNDD